MDDAMDMLGERSLMTPAGPVDLSLASHDDGTLSVVAWLLPAGRRVGSIRSHPRLPELRETMIDPALSGCGLGEAMGELLEEGLAPVATGRSAAAAAALAATDGRDLRDLRGLQWLLSELGNEQPLEVLAAELGLDASSAGAAGG